ncbi:MAG: hypothetical protein QFB87_04570 [Patescibacteria group bacterium]|nr:hypothetical protein [Patescibacteria group bacterium]
MNTMQALANRVDRFIAKAQGDNPDLDAVREDDDFTTFKQDFATAILAQAVWTAKQLDNLSEEYIARDLGSMSNEQKLGLLAYLRNNMPPMSELMDKATLNSWFTKVFESGAVSVYRANNLPVEFKLTNSNYISQIAANTDFLLEQSSLDETTRKALVNLIASDRADGLTREEIASDIQDQFDTISATRAEMIADTETNGMLNRGQFAAMKESGVQMKAWLALGPNPCEITCLSNSGDDYIPMDSMFGSGDLMPPGHPRCECSLDYMNLDISPADVWEGE